MGTLRGLVLIILTLVNDIKNWRRREKLMTANYGLPLQRLIKKTELLRLKPLTLMLLRIVKVSIFRPLDSVCPHYPEKDLEDIKFGVKEGVNLIAASFTRTADNIIQIKKLSKRIKG